MITKPCGIVVAIMTAVITLGTTLLLIILVHRKMFSDDGVEASHGDRTRNATKTTIDLILSCS